MDQNKLNELEAAEADAKDAYREARAAANAARITLGEQTLAGMGVLTDDQARELLRSRISPDYNQSQMALDAGVTRAMVSQAMNGKPIGKSLAAFLGLKRTVVYVPVQVHAGKKAYAVEIEKIKVEGE